MEKGIEENNKLRLPKNMNPLEFNEYIQRTYFDKFEDEKIYVTISLNIPVKLTLIMNCSVEFLKITKFIEETSFQEGIVLKIMGSYPESNFMIFNVKHGSKTAEEIKEYFCGLETEFSGGRILDIDVFFEKKCLKSDRNRACYLCSKPHDECRRSKTHTFEQVNFAFLKNMVDFLYENLEDKKKTEFNTLKVNLLHALLSEVMFEKPFLVSPEDSGLHEDMDFKMFLNVIFSIYREFKYFFYIPFLIKNPVEAFKFLRLAGLDIEKKMMEVTDTGNTGKGVNTHKGAIFIFGIVFSALGYEFSGNSNVCKIFKLYGQLSLLDFESENQSTSGLKLHKTLGIKGIRGECIRGFETAFSALKWFENLQEGDFDKKHYLLLTYIMSKLEDTNIIKKTGGMEFLTFQQTLQNILEEVDGIDFEILDSCVKSFLGKYEASPGGSADVLALTVFLDRI